MTRKEAREHCFVLMFEYEVQKNSPEEMLAYLYENVAEPGKQKEYLETVVKTAVEHLGEIDAVIEKNTNGWKINRLPKVTLAVLRVAVCEMLYMDDISDGIAINEAVEIAKKYHDEKNGKFVNGILSSVFKGK